MAPNDDKETDTDTTDENDPQSSGRTTISLVAGDSGGDLPSRWSTATGLTLTRDHPTATVSSALARYYVEESDAPVGYADELGAESGVDPAEKALPDDDHPASASDFDPTTPSDVDLSTEADNVDADGEPITSDTFTTFDGPTDDLEAGEDDEEYIKAVDEGGYESAGSDDSESDAATDDDSDSDSESDSESDNSDDEEYTCAGKDGECTRTVDEAGDYCWQHED